MVKITIFGMAGTGTSTNGKQLARELNYPFASGGDMGRITAKELGVTIDELDELSKSDKKYDIIRDNHLREFGQKHADCVIEARLGWYVAPDSFKVKLFCADEVRFNRIARRENKPLEQVMRETVERENAIKERFLNYYGIDFDKQTSDENFDLVIDTGKHNIEEVVAIIKEKKIKYEKFRIIW